MDNILFILNPVAGGGKAKDLIPVIEEYMETSQRSYKMILTTKPKEAIDLARDNVDNYDIIVAVGGDGTVNEVAKGIISTGKGTLGIVPGGTGNDMVKSLGISTDTETSLETIIKGTRKEIDIGKINKISFLNIASIGFDAEVIINHGKFKGRVRGKLVYILSVIYTLFFYKDKELEIDIDGKRLDEHIMLLAVGNGRYYGGGMQILPSAKVDDGYLHICIVSNISRIRALFLFPTLFKGNHINYKKYVKIYKGKNIKVRSKDEIYLNIDGDSYPKEREFQFKLDNNKLKVICERG